eukprot:scaffold228567_cov20-Prasinocladus_malaysianus.AAC.1
MDAKVSMQLTVKSLCLAVQQTTTITGGHKLICISLASVSRAHPEWSPIHHWTRTQSKDSARST